MRIDPQHAVSSTAHHGLPYQFCSTGCRNTFTADPARFTDQRART
jgi:YHS domain-containing protein